MKITEEEKKEILSKYKDDTSDELLSHLKREFTVSEVNFEWKDEPFKFIKIEDKMRPLADNKKYLVNKIFSIVEDDWISLGEKKIRRTIKKYLDGIK